MNNEIFIYCIYLQKGNFLWIQIWFEWYECHLWSCNWTLCRLSVPFYLNLQWIVAPFRWFPEIISVENPHDWQNTDKLLQLIFLWYCREIYMMNKIWYKKIYSFVLREYERCCSRGGVYSVQWSGLTAADMALDGLYYSLRFLPPLSTITLYPAPSPSLLLCYCYKEITQYI